MPTNDYSRGKTQQGLPVQAKRNGNCHICGASYQKGDKLIYLHRSTAAHPDCVYQPA